MPTISKATEKTFYALALVRISLGFVFLWAFLDKLFGLGFATCRDAATNAVDVMCKQSWAADGSPTAGFLGHAVKGPFQDFYNGLAGSGLVDWLFMLGLLAAGVGLLLGIWTRLAVVIGALMLFLMWTALLWPENNPFLDDHIVYILVLAAIYLGDTHQKWGLRPWWSNTTLVKALPFLK